MSIRPFDAWVLRRLLIGHTLNGELKSVSEPFRGLADRLAVLSANGRQAEWEIFLGGRGDQDEIIRTLAAVDPDGDPPLQPAVSDGQVPSDPSVSRGDKKELPPIESKGASPRLTPGQVVRANDRGNFGHVVEDLGDSAKIRFVSPGGIEAKPILSKSILANPDGAILTGVGEPGEDGWPLMRFGEIPGVPPFPVEVLPEPAARLVWEGAEAIGCPKDFLGLAVLAVAGGVIGRSVHLLMKDGYFAGATLYAGCIGPPSDGKTPAIKAVAAGVRRIDEGLEAEHADAMEEWNEACRLATEAGEQGEKPPRPNPRRIDVDDITMEAIPNILEANPRGLVMIRDELAAFVLGMNQFKGGKGNDRSNALKIWSGDAIKKDRVGHENKEPIRCAHPSLTILGGLTPDMLGELLDPKGRSDGFIERFLLVAPDPMPISKWTERGISPETAEGWYDLLLFLWGREMVEEEGGGLVPKIVSFTPEGKARWTEHYDALAAEMNGDGFHPSLRGTWGKYREYAGRLALILACLEHAATPSADPARIPSVGPREADNAWALISYFKSHAVRVHAVIARGLGVGNGPAVKAVADWMRAGGRLSFSVRDIKQARRWITPTDLSDALRYLTDRNVIRPLPGKPRGPAGGRPPSTAYEVNPSFLDAQNP